MLCRPMELAKLPYDLVKKVQELDGDIASVQAEVAYTYPDLELTNEQVRQLVRYAVEEKEHDVLAFAPSNVDVLSKKIDISLGAEIDRITAENVTLHQLAVADPDKTHTIRGESYNTTPDEAKERLAFNTKRLLEMKKVLSEQKKVESGPGDTNVQVNLGDIFTEALDNIKRMEAM